MFTASLVAAVPRWDDTAVIGGNDSGKIKCSREELSLPARETLQMPRRPRRPKPPGRKAKRVRSSAIPERFSEEPVVVRARLAAARESLKILSEPAPSTIELARSINDL